MSPPNLPRIPLAQAERIATVVAERLDPLCSRIAIAGSIRRRRQSVGDIDLVVIPRDLAALVARLNQSTRLVSGKDSNQIRIMTVPKLGDVQLDIFVAHEGKSGLFGGQPGNWGSLLLCRTGSPRHNIRICARAKENGFSWHPYQGVKNAQGDIIVSETEEQIYAALGLPFIDPINREVPNF